MSAPTTIDPAAGGDGLDADAAHLLEGTIRQAATSNDGAALDAALDAIGWADALDAAPAVAVAALFDQQGRSATTSSALSRLVGHSLGLQVDAAPLVVLPAFGSAAPPGARDGVRGLGTRGLLDAARAVVVAHDGPELRWAEVPTSSLELRAIGGLDEALGLVEVTGASPGAAAQWSPTETPWDRAVATCRLAVGHQLAGAMRTMLDLARTHALDRVQFDRPIAGFQAVRHRLAETLVAVEAAEAALAGAWEDGSPTAAALATVVCGESARTVRRHSQQVLAGIGFTDEHDLHRYVRRTIVLDGLFGDARTVAAELGAQALAGSTLPRLLPL